MTANEYKRLLYKATNGTVKLLGNFTTLNGAYAYQCKDCGLKFFNRASYMLVSEDNGRNHLCGFKYASSSGKRNAYADREY